MNPILRTGLRFVSRILLVLLILTATSSQFHIAYAKSSDAIRLASITSDTGSTGGGQPHANVQPYLSMNYIIAMTGVFPSQGPGGVTADDFMIGEIRLFAGNFAPRGWAFCQGQLLPINQYQALFSILGTTYGGNGSTNFALPDLRGRIPVGTGSGSGLTTVALGQRGGTESTTLTVAQLPAHNHTKPGGATESSGGGQAHSNQQPSLGINYIVALNGLFPPNDLPYFDEQPYVGEIRMFAGNFAPSGYALAYGQLLPISQYTALFALYGTTFGGDGRTNFGIPDLQGRTAIGSGTGNGLSARTIGQKLGQENTMLLTQNLPAHTHSYPVSGLTGATGGNLAHDTMQPSLVLSYRIVTYGIYPSLNDAPASIAEDTATTADAQLAQMRILGYEYGTFEKADGSLLEIVTNEALFSLLGTIYGGDGMNTFALPDLRGRAVLGTGTGAGLSPYDLGQSAGVESVTLTTAQLPSHTHSGVGEMQCGGPGNYTFTTQSNVVIAMTDAGTNLGCLYVQEVTGDHPNATLGIQTGKYWHIEGYQSNQSTLATDDFDVSITLPHSVTPDTNAKVCKYTGTGEIWDCDRTSSTANSVTRTNLSALSEWAVGDNVSPTAVELMRTSAITPVYIGVLAGCSVILLSTLVYFVYRLQKRSLN